MVAYGLRAALIEQMAQGARERGFESSARSFDIRRSELDDHASNHPPRFERPLAEPNRQRN
jgi:hypothetical protein